MSKILLTLLIILPIAIGALLVTVYGFDNDGVSLFAGVLIGSMLTGCWNIFGRHYRRIVEHQNGLLELQLRLDRVWSAATYNVKLLQQNLATTRDLSEGRFFKLLNKYSDYEDLPDQLILKIANNDLASDLLVLNKRIIEGCDALRLIEDLWVVKVEPHLSPTAAKVSAQDYESTKQEIIRLFDSAIEIHRELVEALDDRLADARVLVAQRDKFTKMLTRLSKQEFQGERLTLRRRELQVMKGERDRINKPMRNKRSAKSG